ncbi:MAG: cupredoxin domain-containing protein [Candidatus Micrarchaeota archaeon]
MKKVALLFIPLLILALFISGCPQQSYPQPPATRPSTQPPAPDNATTASVIIQNFAFNPPALTVGVGTTVKWTNQDSAPHTIKSGAFNSGNLNKGDSFEFKFNTKGTYDYLCGLHPSMKGKIIVE